MAPGRVLLRNMGPESRLCQSSPPAPPGPARWLVSRLECSLWFSSQDGLREGAAMKRRSSFCWCGHIPGRPLALHHVCDPTEKGRLHAHECAPGILSREQRHKATGNIHAHPPHVDELERSSNTNSDIGGLSQEEAYYSCSSKSQAFLSPPLTGWSFSSSQHHPSLFPSCPAPRTEGSHVPSLSAPHLQLCSWRKSHPLTLGERFREIVCPSLLRKEMGDLVLAIRTALSSAFRSEASEGRNSSVQGQPRGRLPAGGPGRSERSKNARENAHRGLHARPSLLHAHKQDQHLPRSISVTKPSASAFQKLQSACVCGSQQSAKASL